MSKTKKLLSLNTVGAVSLVFAGSAFADVRATSVVEITNLTFSLGGSQLDFSDFSDLNYTNSADYDVSLSGYSTLSQEITGSTSSINFPMGCLGDCPVMSEDSYPLLSGAVTGTFAAADQIEEGSPITNQPGFDPSAGAHVANASYAAIAEGDINTASVNSNNGLTANWTFTADNSGQLVISFNLKMYTEAFVTNDELFPGFAQATANLNFTIAPESDPDNDLVDFTISSDISRNAPTTLEQVCGPYKLVDFGGGNLQTFNVACGAALQGPFFAVSGSDLVAGTKYNLTARINTNADVKRVPEPGVLALFGAGLMALTLGRSRRRNGAP